MDMTTVIDPGWLASMAALMPDSIKIQSKTETVGDYGAIGESWTDVAGMTALACNAEEVSVAERRGAPRTIVVGAYMVVLGSYQPTITSAHRAVLWSRNFDITGVWHPFSAFTKMTLQEVV